MGGWSPGYGSQHSPSSPLQRGGLSRLGGSIAGALRIAKVAPIVDVKAAQLVYPRIRSAPDACSWAMRFLHLAARRSNRPRLWTISYMTATASLSTPLFSKLWVTLTHAPTRAPEYHSLHPLNGEVLNKRQRVFGL